MLFIGQEKKTSSSARARLYTLTLPDTFTFTIIEVTGRVRQAHLQEGEKPSIPNVQTVNSGNPFFYIYDLPFCFPCHVRRVKMWAHTRGKIEQSPD
jgi:hypothetical protein